MNHRLFKLLVVALFIPLLAACAGKRVDPNDHSRSVIFGYIDMDDAPTSLDWVFVRHYDGTEDGYHVAGKKGIFYHVGVLPGPYQVDSFGGSGFLAGEHMYSISADGRNDTAVEVRKPGAYFLGSFRYIDVKTGFFQADKFTIEPVNSPDEKDVLLKVMQRMKKENPNYHHAMDMVKARLAELGAI